MFTYISDTTRRKREYEIDGIEDEELDRVKRGGNNLRPTKKKCYNSFAFSFRKHAILFKSIFSFILIWENETIEIVDANGNPCDLTCSNGGACQNDTGTAAVCNCGNGYTGSSCENGKLNILS